MVPDLWDTCRTSNGRKKHKVKRNRHAMICIQIRKLLKLFGKTYSFIIITHNGFVHCDKKQGETVKFSFLFPFICFSP
jgi:hypothetical protein